MKEAVKKITRNVAADLREKESRRDRIGPSHSVSNVFTLPGPDACALPTDASQNTSATETMPKPPAEALRSLSVENIALYINQQAWHARCDGFERTRMKQRRRSKQVP